VFVGIMAEMDVPYYVVPGERDYIVEAVTNRLNPIVFADWAERHAFLKDTLQDAYPGPDSWYVKQHKGANLLFLNTMAGPLWNTGNGGTGSLGADQLDALSAQLAAALPCVMLGHHSPQLSLETAGVTGWRQRLADQPGAALGVIHGHRQQFAMYDIEGLPVFSVGDPGPAGLHYAVVEVDPQVPSIEVLNLADLPVKPSYPGVPESCEPGSTTVEGVDQLVGSYHAILFDSFTSDSELLNDLIGELLMNEQGKAMGFPIHVRGASELNSYEILVTEAYKVDLAEGQTAVISSWNAMCEAADYTFTSPCMTATAPLSYNLQNKFEEIAGNVPLVLDITLHVDVEMGPGQDGELTFSRVQASMVLNKAYLTGVLRKFLVDSYCGIAGGLGGEECDPALNGHLTACEGGTLTFDEIPVKCDVLLGTVPVRTVLFFGDLLPFDNATMVASGWGQRLTPLFKKWSWQVCSKDDPWAFDVEQGFPANRCSLLPVSSCGDGICNGSDDCFTCAEDCGVCPSNMQFVSIPAGSFWMGSPDGVTCPDGYPGSCDAEPGRESDETLAYVTLTRGFEIMAHEVTIADWQSAFGAWDPTQSPNCNAQHPVEGVSFYDALVFANQKSLQAGLTPCFQLTGVDCTNNEEPDDYMTCMDPIRKGIKKANVTLAPGIATIYDCPGYRLPTEAEWEYAARAGTTTAYSNGQSSHPDHLWCQIPFHLEDIAWYCGTANTSRMVGQKLPNAWGLYDVHGNVDEWTWDSMGPRDASTMDAPSFDPAPEGFGSSRVMKSGGWGGMARHARSAIRVSKQPLSRSSFTGLRLVKTVSGQ
jgi:formylglycine-generating enzyme required for sulfatase activity